MVGRNQAAFAFITYGASDARPSPIFERRPFAPLTDFNKIFTPQISPQHGIGQAPSSTSGMAILEAMVAALKVGGALPTCIVLNVLQMCEAYTDPIQPEKALSGENLQEVGSVSRRREGEGKRCGALAPLFPALVWPAASSLFSSPPLFQVLAYPLRRAP